MFSQDPEGLLVFSFDPPGRFMHQCSGMVSRHDAQLTIQFLNHG